MSIRFIYIIYIIYVVYSAIAVYSAGLRYNFSESDKTIAAFGHDALFPEYIPPKTAVRISRCAHLERGDDCPLLALLAVRNLESFKDRSVVFGAYCLAQLRANIIKDVKTYSSNPQLKYFGYNLFVQFVGLGIKNPAKSSHSLLDIPISSNRALLTFISDTFLRNFVSASFKKTAHGAVKIGLQVVYPEAPFELEFVSSNGNPSQTNEFAFDSGWSRLYYLEYGIDPHVALRTDMFQTAVRMLARYMGMSMFFEYRNVAAAQVPWLMPRNNVTLSVMPAITREWISFSELQASFSKSGMDLSRYMNMTPPDTSIRLPRYYFQIYPFVARIYDTAKSFSVTDDAAALFCECTAGIFALFNWDNGNAAGSSEANALAARYRPFLTVPSPLHRAIILRFISDGSESFAQIFTFYYTSKGMTEEFVQYLLVLVPSSTGPGELSLARYLNFAAFYYSKSFFLYFSRCTRAHVWSWLSIRSFYGLDDLTCEFLQNLSDGFEYSIREPTSEELELPAAKATELQLWSLNVSLAVVKIASDYYRGKQVGTSSNCIADLYRVVLSKTHTANFGLFRGF